MRMTCFALGALSLLLSLVLYLVNLVDSPTVESQPGTYPSFSTLRGVEMSKAYESALAIHPLGDPKIEATAQGAAIAGIGWTIGAFVFPAPAKRDPVEPEPGPTGDQD
ncbi:hypothetical protein ACOBQX_09365 [Actinokineospora sp. G85]|uniref:hypothetical protein n=1 Tax=Actinokineospora sp. G85 TaxID=3406626 RepID=UPI003C7136E4